MKKIFIFAAAAAMFASCSQDELLTEVEPSSNVEQAIGFGTWTNKATRGTGISENNGLTCGQGLENYYETFKVWGYKNINSSEGKHVANTVFDSNDNAANSLVTYSETPKSPFSTKWWYAPARYWDKSAVDYDFHAATPSTVAWVFALKDAADNKADDAKKRGYFTLAAQTINGESLPLNTAVTAQPDDHFTLDNDLMIANDVIVTPTGYTNAEIELDFNHILSRLNIGVKIGTAMQGRVKYDQKPRMVTYGESATETQLYQAAEDNRYYVAVEDGKYQAVTESAGNATKIEEDAKVGTDLHLTALTVDDTTKPTEGIVLLEKVAVHKLFNKGKFNEETAEPSTTGTYARWTLTAGDNATVFAQFPNTEVTGAEDGDESTTTLNLSKSFEATLPGATTATEVKVDDFKYVYQGLVIPQPAAVEDVELDGSNAGGLEDAYLEIKYTVDGETFHFFYNLATVFTKASAAAEGDASNIAFYEGWQNNLQIIINPALIQFVAHVFPWATKVEHEFTVE